MYYDLQKNLNEITKDSDLQDIVFKLIQTAESQGWLEDLVCAARDENPRNSTLQAIAQKLLTNHPGTPSVPLPSMPLKQTELNDNKQKENNNIKLENGIIDVNVLVHEVKNKIYTDIESRCGTMRVLDMTHPMGLRDIYTDVNILETITGRRRLGINELLINFEPESKNFNRCGLGQIAEERVPGLQVVSKYPRLMVLGKPGAGKTTFLKYIALQSIWGKFLADRVPIFVTLKDFSDKNNYQHLLSYIVELFREYTEYSVTKNQLVQILENGRAIVLLDGLDEVREEYSKRILKEISNFSNKFFLSKDFTLDRTSFITERNQKNIDIEKQSSRIEKHYKDLELRQGRLENSVTKLKKKEKELEDEYNECKISEKQYQEKYLEIKIERDKINQERLYLEPEFKKEKERLDEEKKKFEQALLQFESKFPDILQHSDQGLEFLSRKFPDRFYNNHFIITCRIAAKEYTFENFVEVEVADFDDKQIRTFAKNWFDSKDSLKSYKFIQRLSENESVRELASNPLLLTLLCLVFEESTSFYSNRSQLYKEGISILLKKWDAQRLIEREQIYQNLSSTRKEDLLSQIAKVTFERKDYFFKQKDVELYISEYIRNLPDARTDLEALRLDSEAVLKSIEAQHGLLVERAKGIYSFSHLTFQEYFTARKIVMDSDPIALSKGLQSFVEHMIERRWVEVFLLAVGILPSADYLLRLMKGKADSLLANDNEIQQFLAWAKEKALKVKPPIDKLFARAFYFAIYSDHNLALSIARSRSSSKYRQTFTNLISNFSLAKECATELNSTINSEVSYIRNIRNRVSQLLNILEKVINIAQLLSNDLVNTLDQNFNNFRTTNLSLAYTLNPELNHIQVLIATLDFELVEMLWTLRQQLPDLLLEDDKLKRWWRDNGQTWTQMLHQTLARCQNLGRDWPFSEEQRKLLRLYCDANKLIVDCLNSDCYVSYEVREEINQKLLLPFVESDFQ